MSAIRERASLGFEEEAAAAAACAAAATMLFFDDKEEGEIEAVLDEETLLKSDESTSVDELPD